MIYPKCFNQDSKKCIKRTVLNLRNEWLESIKSEMLLVWKRQKLLKGITTKITKECNALCHDVIAKH